MKRTFVLFALTITAALAGAATTPPVARPNVIVVMADQWRANAFGYAGELNVQTPNLDRLERESVHFVNAISGMPVCCPMRASFLTGQRALTHGVFLNDVPLSTNAVTIAKTLKGAGYDTAVIGKWHVDGHGRSSYIPEERHQGFDYWKVLECTHDYNGSFYYAGNSPVKLKWEGYDALAQTRDAENYLRDHAKADKPFFLFLAWGPPHDPYQTAPEKYRAMYAPEKFKLPPNIPTNMIAQARQMMAGYYAHCTALDDCLGELRATLEKAGLAQNTLLLFTADHGDLLGSHGGRNKQQPYEESIRVPLLLHWPAGFGSQPRQLDALINSEDLMPTILGLCGTAIPKSVEGLDYSGYILGGKNPSDGTALMSCAAPFGQWTRQRGGKEYRAIRTLRHTYVRDLNGPWLMFDDVRDPYQLTNLVGQAEFAKLQAELDATLKRKLAAAHDEFLPGDAYIKKWGYKVDATGTAPYAP